MYVADREMGILVADIKGGRAGTLALPDNFNIGGIDGLYLWDNHLIIIQNGIKPQRVMRLKLDASGTRVEAVRPLAVAQAEFDYPSFGTMKGNELYYFQQKAVTVLRTAADSSADLAQPDMQEYLRQRGEKLEAKQKGGEKD